MRLLLCVFLICSCGAWAQNGSAIYRSRCSSCHEAAATAGAGATAGVGRAPTLQGFKKIEPEQVESALVFGAMASQAGNLSREDIRAVATFVTGKQFAPDAPEHFTCKGVAPDFEKASNGPHWTGWGVNPSNTRSQPAEMARLTPEQVPQLQLKWAFGFEGLSRMMSQPTVAGGRVFIAGAQGKVYSLDAATGCVRWVFKSAATVRSPITVGKVGSDWIAYFGDMAGSAYAVNATNGALMWKTKVDEFAGAQIAGAATLFEGHLYVTMSSMEEVQAADLHYECCRFRGSITDLDAATGKVNWKSYTIADEPRPTHKNSAGTQMWGPSGAAILSAATIDPVKRAIYVTDGDSYSDPMVDTSDAFLAFSMDTGKLLWSAQMTKDDGFNDDCLMTDMTSCPAVPGPDVDFLQSPMLVSLPTGGRALIAGQKSGIVSAIDPDAKGKVLWRVSLGDGLIGWGGAADEKNVYMAYSGKKVDANQWNNPDLGGGLFALDLVTGHSVWYAAPGVCSMQPGCSPAQGAALTLIPGVVFSASVDGHLRAYQTSDGFPLVDLNTVQTFKTVNGVKANGGSMELPGPVIVDGVVFVDSGFGFSGGIPGNVLLSYSVGGK